jgi:DNA-binding response OmpR family regulator
MVAKHLINQARGTSQQAVRRGPFFVDLRCSKLVAGSDAVDLTPTQVRIFWILCRHADTVVTLDELTTEAGNSIANTTTKRAMAQQLLRLKERLGPWARHIESRRGSGFMLKIKPGCT